MPDAAPPPPVRSASAAPEGTDLAASLGRALAGSLDLERTLDRLMDLLVPAHATWAQVTLAGPYGGQVVVCRAADGTREHVEEPVPDAETPGSVAGVVLTGRRAVLSDVAAEDLEGLLPPDAVAGAGSLLGSSGVVLPLVGRGSVFGTLTLLGDEQLVAPEALGVLDDLAEQSALFLDAARLHAERSRIGRFLQRGLPTPATRRSRSACTRAMPASCSPTG